MKIICATFLICFLNFNLKAQTDEQFIWTPEKESQHLKNIQDSTTWDMELLSMDVSFLKHIQKGKYQKDGPISWGAFPVPKYDLVDNHYNGLTGGFYFDKEINGKKIKYLSAAVNVKGDIDSTGCQKGLGDKTDKVYFSICILTDTIDRTNYALSNYLVLSRNHPNYMTQGFVKTKSDQIDFVAFQTADRNAYAIVNMRLFDLKNGAIILIAPQKDGSLRSLQLQAPLLSYTKMNEHIDRLIQEEGEVKEFFTKQGNI